MVARLEWGPDLWDAVPSGCWEWNRNRDVGGYGIVWRRKAHRVAWQFAHARMLTPFEVVRHTCDNPLCVNPAHLVVGVQAQNVQDMDARGRRYQPTHCPHGHVYTPENTVRNSNGGRKCRVCARVMQARWRAKKKIS